MLKFKKTSHNHDEQLEPFNVNEAIIAYASNLNMIENVDAFERSEFNQYLIKNLSNTELYNIIKNQESITMEVEPALIKAIHLEISKFIYRDTEHQSFCAYCCKPCHCDVISDEEKQKALKAQEEEKARLKAEEEQRILLMQQEEALLQAQRLEEERLAAQMALREAEEAKRAQEEAERLRLEAEEIQAAEEINMAQAASEDEVQAREQQVLVKSEKAIEGIEKQTVMISVSPDEAIELFDNGKSAIFFKVTPVYPVGRVVVYVTSPIKKVLGEFDLLDIKKGKVSRMWDSYKDYSVISTNKVFKYFMDHTDAHALIASRVYKYRNPKELASFDMKRGPSGFTYLK